jgi:drug/metabolite transporter (DMT)-like permease
MWLILAALAAIAFGVRGMLYHHTSQRRLERSLLLAGVFSCGAILCLIIGLASGDDWSSKTLVGILMGCCSFVANLSMFRGFAVGKASVVAILTALPPVVVASMAYIIWGERLTIWQLLSVVIIVLGILIVRYAKEFSLSHLEGAKWGLIAMLFFGFNDITSKWSTMLGADTFPTLFWMFATGTVLFLAAWRLERRGAASMPRQQEPSLKEEARWGAGRTFGVGLMIGTTNAVGMVLLLNAFEIGVTGLVSAVVALNVLLILLYTRLVVKERFTPRELSGMALALAGVLLLRLLG